MTESTYRDHPIQAIMSRTGSFPLRVAHQLLARYAGVNSRVILDPFCGKGTSLLASRMLGYSAYGIDVAPEAVICASAKMAGVQLEEVVKYIRKLPTPNERLNPVPAPLKSFFHAVTLSQILVIRDKLMVDFQSMNEKKRDRAAVTLACLLGILHGHASYSLSVSSAHAFSMSPAYVGRYALAHGLTPPIQDVRACLIKKISSCLNIELPAKVPNQVRRGSALNSSAIFPSLVGKVDLILTSPPYLNAQTYAKDNWLRLWLLGYDYRDLQADYLQTGSIQRYEDKMKSVFVELSAMLKVGGRLICIAGDVNSSTNGHRELFKTGLSLARICDSSAFGLKVENRERHKVLSNNRYLHSISQSNGHSEHDLIERVFVARKL